MLDFITAENGLAPILFVVKIDILSLLKPNTSVKSDPFTLKETFPNAVFRATTPLCGVKIYS